MEVHVLCRGINLPLLQNLPHIASSIAYHETLEARLVAELNTQKFDALLVLVNDEAGMRLVPQLNNIPVRIGPLSKPSRLFHLTHPVLQKRSRSIKSEAQYNLDLLQVFNWQGEPPRPKLEFSQTEETRFLADLAKLAPKLDRGMGFIALHAGMHDSALNWPFDHYRGLLSELLAAGYQVVLTGNGKGEIELGRQMSLGLPQEAKLIDLSGQLELRQLALLFRYARLYIGGSTGPTHVANAALCPIISFYPPIRVQSATRWAPFLADGEVLSPPVECKQAYKCIGEVCPDKDCMGKISVEAAFKAVKRQIRPNPLAL